MRESFAVLMVAVMDYASLTEEIHVESPAWRDKVVEITLAYQQGYNHLTYITSPPRYQKSHRICVEAMGACNEFFSAIRTSMQTMDPAGTEQGYTLMEKRMSAPNGKSRGSRRADI